MRSTLFSLAALAVSATCALASQPLQQSHQLSWTKTKYHWETNRNPRAYITDEGKLGEYLRQDDCSATIVDLRETSEFNDYQGHIKGSVNIPLDDKEHRAKKLGKQIEQGQLPAELNNEKVQQSQYVVFMAMDDTSDTVHVAASYFNYVASKNPNQQVVICVDEYKNFRRNKANKMLVEYSAGAQGHMNFPDAIKEGAKHIVGGTFQKIADRLTSRELKATRRDMVSQARQA